MQMSNIAEFNSAANADVDREHEVQLGLLRALCVAAGENRAASEIGEILDHLIAYSEAHFMSEELLMRQMSYDDYEDHVGDHVRMLEALDEIAEAQASGKSVLVSGKAESILKFIKQHIATRDQRFADFLLRGVA